MDGNRLTDPQSPEEWQAEATLTANTDTFAEEELQHFEKEVGVTPVFAGFLIRFLALALDAIALYSLNLILRALTGQPIDDPTFGFLFFELMYGLAYFVILTTMYGQTLGKMVLGLQVVRTVPKESSQLGTMIYRECFGKFLSVVTLGIGYLMAGWSRHHRALHDMVADTAVIILPIKELRHERESAQ